MVTTAWEVCQPFDDRRCSRLLVFCYRRSHKGVLPAAHCAADALPCQQADFGPLRPSPPLCLPVPLSLPSCLRLSSNIVRPAATGGRVPRRSKRHALRSGRPHPIGWLFRADWHYGGVPPRAGDLRGAVSVPRQAVRGLAHRIDRCPTTISSAKNNPHYFVVICLPKLGCSSEGVNGSEVSGNSNGCMCTKTLTVFRRRLLEAWGAVCRLGLCGCVFDVNAQDVARPPFGVC